MRRQHRNGAGRCGFTMVELLVAMALIVFIMYILAEAFSAGAKTFRDLKAVGDLNTRLRTATSTLRRLLSADHFEGRKRLSDPNFWQEGPPRMGFFRIWQNSAPTNTTGAAYFNEGNDLDNAPSFRARDHGMHFTVRLRGGQRSDYFRATVPAGSPLLSLPQPDSRYQDGTNEYTSSWAEVAVFLRPVPGGEDTEDPNATSGSPLPLNTLYLRQRLLVPSRDDVDSIGAVPSGQANQYLEVSQFADGTNLAFNTPADITMPARRFGNSTPPSLALNVAPLNYPRLQDESTTLSGSDVLLTDVISMEIRVLLGSEGYVGAEENFIHLFDGQIDKYRMMFTGNPPGQTANSEIPNTARVFDTWSQLKDDKWDYSTWARVDQRSGQAIPMFSNVVGTKPIRIRAIQIALRIWDNKTKQTRQVSLIQDM
ncbi:MAG: prepilin-type N-terminal cleavage/methylation domain-containing protein [Gemmataceae bacterium]